MRTIKRKYFIVEATVVVLVIAVGMAVMLPRFLQAQNFNTPGNFPDPAFRQEIEKLLQVKPGGYFSKDDVQQIKQIRLDNVQIKNFAGIEYLTGLTHLGIVSDELTTIDLYSFVHLSEIYLEGRQLTQVEIHECKALTKLDIWHTALEELDTSGNPKLTELYITDSRIQSLDLKNNPNLLDVVCRESPLKQLDVTGLTKLDGIDCSISLISEIDVSTNTALTVLLCYSTKIRSLNISNNPNLEFLNASDNSITELDISNNSNLDSLLLSENQFVELPEFYDHIVFFNLHLDDNQLDCEDWEAFKQLEMYVDDLQFLPQKTSGIKNCVEDIELYQSDERWHSRKIKWELDMRG